MLLGGELVEGLRYVISISRGCFPRLNYKEIEKIGVPAEEITSTKMTGHRVCNLTNQVNNCVAM